jgi:ubiquinone biosynthesis protein UbiJ
MGDISANKAALFSKKSFIMAKKQSINAVEMLSEYWQEEKPILAKKWRVEQFNNQVDTLRSDYARFEKTLEKLAKKVKESSSV